MRISDWSSDVCSSDLRGVLRRFGGLAFVAAEQVCHAVRVQDYALADQSPRHVDARRATRCRRATDLPDPSHVRTRACVLLPPQRGGVRHLRSNAEARWRTACWIRGDRKSVVEGKSVSEGVN